MAGAAGECFNPLLYTAGTSYQVTYDANYAILGGVTTTRIDVGASTDFEGVLATPVVKTIVNLAAPAGPQPYTTSYFTTDGFTILWHGLLYYEQRTDSNGVTTFGQQKAVYSPPRRDSRFSLQTASQSVTDDSIFDRPKTITYLGQESVTVRAGTFLACKFRVEQSGTGPDTEWIHKGTGLRLRIEGRSGSLPYYEELLNATFNGAPL